MITNLPSGVRVDRGQGGLERVLVQRAEVTAELFLHGATLTAWQPRGVDPVLWLSRAAIFHEDKAIRGGVPICFPWFGSRADNPQAATHGFARVMPWTFASAVEDERSGAVVLELTLSSSPETFAIWPHEFRARYRVKIGGKLELELTVTNPGAAPFTYEEALHSYFSVKDVARVRVEGLERSSFLDKLDGFARKRQGSDPVIIDQETDRVYTGNTAATEIVDPVLQRSISIVKDGSRSTVVWNPWIARARALKDFGDDEWREMLCVEAGNVGPDEITLAPGASHTLRKLVSINRL